MGPTPTPTADRFWAKVEKTDTCWLWTAAVASGGYGQIWEDGRYVLAHVWSYIEANGPIENYGRGRGKVGVLHECDNRRCVRPSHLFIGTAQVNAQDAKAKGRLPSGDRHWSKFKPELVPRGVRHRSVTSPETLARGLKNGWYTKPECRPDRRGEKNGRAKLTDDQVEQIKSLVKIGGLSHRAVAIKFSVSHSAIDAIIAGRRRAN